MKRTLWRAAKDDYVDQGYSFAETREAAEAYLDNAGFGGGVLFQAKIQVEPERVLDWRDVEVNAAAEKLGLPNPGAIGLDEWLPRTVQALDALRDLGFLWVRVSESFPEDTTTWIWVGTSFDDEPELEEVTR